MLIGQSSLILLAGFSLFAIEPSARVTVGDGFFDFQSVRAEGAGTERAFKMKFSATTRNATGKKWYWMQFCITGFDSEDRPILAGGEKCLITLTGREWEIGQTLNFDASNKIRLGDDRSRPVTLARYEIKFLDGSLDPGNVKRLAEPCTRVWPVALQEFIRWGFKPTMSDKESGLASFEYTSGVRNHTNEVKAYTTGGGPWLAIWKLFRIDSATLNLSADDTGCRAEVSMAFAAYNDNSLGTGWYAFQSNHNFERELLAAVAGKVKSANVQTLRQIAERLPAESPGAARPTPVSTEKESDKQLALSVTSEPSGAEIDINGAFVGSTGSTVPVTPGRIRIVIKKRGYFPWQRDLEITAGGGTRTVHAELERDPSRAVILNN